MKLKTKYLLSVISIALALFFVLAIEIIYLYLNPSNLAFYYVFMLTAGISIVIFLRAVYGIPFPHEHTKFQNPDPNGYLKLLEKVEEGDKLKIVMGEANPEVLNEMVQNKFSEKIKKVKGFEVKIIVGPQVHTKSQNFFRTIIESSPTNAKIYRREERPIRHFRLLENKYLILEPPHAKFKKSKYWEFKNSRYLNRKYHRLFNEYEEESKLCETIDDIQFIIPKDIIVDGI